MTFFILILSSLCLISFSYHKCCTSYRNSCIFRHNLSSSSIDHGRALDLLVNRNDGKVVLETSVFRFETNAEKKTIIDLYSMLHIGDQDYYYHIENDMKDYDIVLFELITENSNTITLDNSNDVEVSASSSEIIGNNESRKPFKRKLRDNVDIMSYKTEKLASDYDLSHQLTINFKQSNYYIADLDTDTISNLSVKRQRLVNSLYWKNQFGGRSFDQNLLKSFFLMDAPFITALRLLSWLGPCPECSCLLFDWARMSAPNKAGGLPLFSVLLPISKNILNGNFREAKKIAFAQQLMSGVVDSGSWGGESKSDVDLIVGQRNNEVCRVIQSFVDEHEMSSTSTIANTDSKILKIAVLYGCYHMKDLTSKLYKLGYMRNFSNSRKYTAWEMTYPIEESSSTSTTSSAPISDGSSVASFNELLPLISISLAYLSLGALDWWVLLKVLTEAIENIDDTVIVNILFFLGYAALYAQRHLVLLRTLSYNVVNWDRDLFG